MAGGGIKVNNNHIRCGADGATFTPRYNEATGELEWSNNKGLNNPPNARVKGATGGKGEKGDKGDTPILNFSINEIGELWVEVI